VRVTRGIVQDLFEKLVTRVGVVMPLFHTNIQLLYPAFQRVNQVLSSQTTLTEAALFCFQTLSTFGTEVLPAMEHLVYLGTLLFQIESAVNNVLALVKYHELSVPALPVYLDCPPFLEFPKRCQQWVSNLQTLCCKEYCSGSSGGAMVFHTVAGGITTLHALLHQLQSQCYMVLERLHLSLQLVLSAALTLESVETALSQ